MNRWFGAGLLAVLLGTALGCGSKNDAAPVAGTVSVDGKPADNATVTFIPQGQTKGNGGSALTDTTGRYEVINPRGGKGLSPGEYKVTVSYRRNADGSPPDPNTPPIESKAKETLPVTYASPAATKLTASVPASGNQQLNFDLKVKK